MNTIKKHYILFSWVVVIATLVSVYFASSLNFAFGNVTSTEGAPLLKSFENYTFFATSTASENLALFSDVYATSTNATSTNITSWFDSKGRKDNGYFIVAGAKNVQFYFGRGGTTTSATTATVKYTVQLSPDGTNWFDFPKIVTASSTKNTQGQMFITTSTTTNSVSLDIQDDSLYAVRCIATYIGVSNYNGNSVDGKNFCSATATY